jgi:hypothetical protein
MPPLPWHDKVAIVCFTHCMLLSSNVLSTCSDASHFIANAGYIPANYIEAPAQPTMSSSASAAAAIQLEIDANKGGRRLPGAAIAALGLGANDVSKSAPAASGAAPPAGAGHRRTESSLRRNAAATAAESSGDSNKTNMMLAGGSAALAAASADDSSKKKNKKCAFSRF